MKALLVGPTSSMVRAGLLVGLTYAAGTIGYKLLGGATSSWADALYMAAITLTTVGYQEAVPVTGNPVAEVFTIILLVSGVTSFMYFVSNLMAFMVEGTLDRFFWKRRMRRRCSRMKDHYIVCGGGRTGVHVMRELHATGRPFVLVEKNEDRVTELVEILGTELVAVIGDACNDHVLAEAGIERARGLVSCAGSDNDNLVVAFSARDLRSDLRIVARCTEDSSVDKLRRAGADDVVSPDHIGGLRLASALVRPTVVGFLDTMLRDKSDFRIEETAVAAGSELEGRTLRDLRSEEINELMVVAIRRPSGDWIYNPPAETVLKAGTGLVFMGTPEARTRIEKATR